MGIDIFPKGKFVLARLGKVQETVTDGGVILPDIHSEFTRYAKIVKVGPDVQDPDVKPDSIWAVQYHAGTALHLVTAGILDDTLRLISESELMARIEEVKDEDK